VTPFYDTISAGLKAAHGLWLRLSPILDSFPQGNQQRREILLVQRQQEIHIPIRLHQLQDFSIISGFVRSAISLCRYQKESGVQTSQTNLTDEISVWMNTTNTLTDAMIGFD